MFRINGVLYKSALIDGAIALVKVPKNFKPSPGQRALFDVDPYVDWSKRAPRVGDIKEINGRKYRLNENKRWVRMKAEPAATVAGLNVISDDQLPLTVSSVASGDTTLKPRRFGVIEGGGQDVGGAGAALLNNIDRLQERSREKMSRAKERKAGIKWGSSPIDSPEIAAALEEAGDVAGQVLAMDQYFPDLEDSEIPQFLETLHLKQDQMRSLRTVFERAGEVIPQAMVEAELSADHMDRQIRKKQMAEGVDLPDLESLFNDADRIGGKYQTPEEQQAFQDALNAEVEAIADLTDQQFPDTETEVIDYSGQGASNVLPLRPRRMSTSPVVADITAKNRSIINKMLSSGKPVSKKSMEVIAPGTKDSKQGDRVIVGDTTLQLIGSEWRSVANDPVNTVFDAQLKRNDLEGAIEQAAFEADQAKEVAQEAKTELRRKRDQVDAIAQNALDKYKPIESEPVLVEVVQPRSGGAKARIQAHLDQLKENQSKDAKLSAQIAGAAAQAVSNLADAQGVELPPMELESQSASIPERRGSLRDRIHGRLQDLKQLEELSNQNAASMLTVAQMANEATRQEMEPSDPAQSALKPRSPDALPAEVIEPDPTPKNEAKFGDKFRAIAAELRESSEDKKKAMARILDATARMANLHDRVVDEISDAVHDDLGETRDPVASSDLSDREIKSAPAPALKPRRKGMANQIRDLVDDMKAEHEIQNHAISRIMGAAAQIATNTDRMIEEAAQTFSEDLDTPALKPRSKKKSLPSKKKEDE